MCKSDVEHVLHLFFDCDFAGQCWQKAYLYYDMREVENAAEWLLALLIVEKDDKVIQYCEGVIRYLVCS